MKKITIDARMINASGIGTFIKNILKRMILLKSDWHFYILGNPKELLTFNYLKVNNVTIIKCIAPIYSIKEQIELIRNIPTDTDIMWSPHYNVPVLYKGKLLVTIHDVFHLAMPQFVNGLHKKLYAKFMFEIVKRKSSKIICVSNFSANELKKYIGVDDSKIIVVYAGVDQDFFLVSIGELVHNKPYLLYVGNVKPHKNLSNLIRAFLNIKDKINYDLIIVGKKEGFITGNCKVEELIKGNEDRIIFTGYVSDDKLKQYYKQAKLFIFPSLYEGFGSPPLEALSAGIPVIASDIPAVKEVCANMVNYFNPYDINDISLTILNNINGKQKNKYDLNKYDWNVCVNKYINLIEQLLEKENKKDLYV